ncbi:hypothetical protein GPECTOR_59g634 [Gonium pectorale]|uniref:Uncharacterized protein n=1 Tax=Gonium pectorale TaxID=33097 RepID=A0A150G567_GONPE|nr:hypothetical protein GPECTOR_59g634 [Gonium pectorale]|eukprot:KXZ45026.1 hypothetical protein GPECTOR_59g634 [Gonium pectorale]
MREPDEAVETAVFAAHGGSRERPGAAGGGPTRTVVKMMDTAALLSVAFRSATSELDSQLRALAAEASGGATRLPKKLVMSSGAGGMAAAATAATAAPLRLAMSGTASAGAAGGGPLGAAPKASGPGVRAGAAGTEALPQPVRDGEWAGEEGTSGLRRPRAPGYSLAGVAQAVAGSLAQLTAPQASWRLAPSADDSALDSLRAAFGLAQWAVGRAGGRPGGLAGTLPTRGSLAGLPAVLAEMGEYERVLQGVVAIAAEADRRASRMLSIADALSAGRLGGGGVAER